MTSAPDWSLTTRALTLLADHGLDVDIEQLLNQFGEFHRICSTWNLAAKLMSRGDLEQNFDGHIADSLSLALELQSHPNLLYVDIGSGGGFPAIPLALLLPDRQCLLVERSQAKASYLSQCAKQLGANNIQTAQGNFPLELDIDNTGCLYTARAIEQPEKFDQMLLGRMKASDMYLMQRRPPEGLLSGSHQAALVEDIFLGAGLRRGTLYRVTR